MNLEKVIEERIGLGWFQVKGVAIITLMIMLDIIEMSLMPVLLPVFINHWKISHTMKIIFSQSVSIGYAIGLLSGGYIGDRHGRLYTLKIGMYM